MTTSKSLPARPSEESLRKQAKKLARDRSLSLREAQLALAREYGFAGWPQLAAEVQKRLGHGLEWAASQAQRIIHDNDVEALKQLLAEYPALLSWQGEKDEGGLLGMATSSYGDSGHPDRERHFTRAACAELLIDAGAVVWPAVCDGLVESRAKGLLHLFERKGLLPRTLKFLVALDDVDGVRARIDTGDDDLASVNDAFRVACRLEYEPIASVLLDRSIALDAELGQQIDAGPGRLPLIKYLMAERTLDFVHPTPAGPWQAFVMHQVVRALQDDDVATFVRGLQRDPWLLGDSFVEFQVSLIGRAVLRDRGACIAALLDLEPALLRRRPPPPSQIVESVFTYAKTHLLPLVTRVWPVPDDLAHSAGMGDLVRVKALLDASNKPGQQVLDTALAWSVINRHFEVADVLLQHGADINTRWSSHEPASILHELVFHNNYESMQFLIDRGIDMTIRDYRWGGTAEGWAYYAANDKKMAQWLADAEQQQKGRS